MALRTYSVLGLVCVAAACGDSKTSRLQARVSISGQVVLSTVTGLDDMSRVRVDIGRGEGGITPDADGSFLFSDVEPDVYSLAIAYIGGFDPEASQSAYRPYAARLVAEEGGSIALGRIQLELGKGTVTGTVGVSGKTPANGAVVKLRQGGASPFETVVVNGEFTIEDVDVGRYELTVEQGGHRSCGEPVVVGYDGATVEVSQEISGAASLTPAADDAVRVLDKEWFLLAGADSVSVVGDATFADEARYWAEGETIPDYSSYLTDTSFEVVGLTEGRTRYHFQFRDRCGVETFPLDLTFVRDIKPPDVSLMQLNSGVSATTSRTVALTVVATDDLSARMEMKLLLCDVDQAGAETCVPTEQEALWQPYTLAQSVTFIDQPGTKRVKVLLQDLSNNVIAQWLSRDVAYDNLPPQDMQIIIGDGSGVIHTPSPVIVITGDGAVEMKVGTTSGLAGVPWESFRDSFRFDFSEGDGIKDLYAVFRDAAGNQTGELHEQVELNTKGSVIGVFRLPGATDHGNTQVSLLGTGFSTTTDVDGNWSIVDVPAGAYNLEATHTNHRAHRTAVTIVPETQLDIGLVVLEDFKSRIVGTVELEGFEGQLNHGDVLVELLGTPYTALTDSAGRFGILVEPTNYVDGLRFSKPGYETYVRPDIISLLPEDVRNVGLVPLSCIENDVMGEVQLVGASDHSGIEVTLQGETGTAVEGLTFSTVTDALGTYTLSLVPLGDYRITYFYPAEAARETFTRGGIFVRPGEPTVIAAVGLRERFVIINDHDVYTTDSTVTLTVGASDCFEMRVSNYVDFNDTTWGACETTLSDWPLLPGNGTRTVYAQFKTQADPNNPTDVVEDDIWVDGTATISSFTHDGASRTLGLGAVLHLSMNAAGEGGGFARATIANYDDNVVLYDDGTRGDATADDGVYERDYVIQKVDDVTGAAVTAYFTDQYGNQTSQAAADPVTVAIAPLITDLDVTTSYTAGTVTVSWKTDELTTGTVDWGTDTSYGTTESSPTLATSHSLSFGSGTLVVAQEYHLRITATDDHSNASASNDRTFLLIPNEPRNVVAIPGIGRVHVRWELEGNTNIDGYRILRSETSGGPYTALNAELCSESSADAACNYEALVYEDGTVVNGTTYYYVVLAVDSAGNDGVASPESSATPDVGLGVGESTSIRGALAGVTVLGEVGSPYVITANTAVEPGGLMVIGPNTRVEFGGTYTLIVHGQLVALGGRGVINGETESDDDMAIITSSTEGDPSPVYWSSIFFEKTSPDGWFDMGTGAYYRGNLVYRTRLSFAEDSALKVADEDIAVIRSRLSENSPSASGASGGGMRIGTQYLPVSTGYRSAKVLIAHTEVSDNSGIGQGAGIYAARHGSYRTNLRILDSLITRNTSQTFQSGSLTLAAGCPGICLQSGYVDLVVRRTEISYNEPPTRTYQGEEAYWDSTMAGGLMHRASGGTLRVEDCLFVGNGATAGAALWTEVGGLIRGNVFAGNRTAASSHYNGGWNNGGQGAAILASGTAPTLVDNVFVENSARRYNSGSWGVSDMVRGRWQSGFTAISNTFIDNDGQTMTYAGEAVGNSLIETRTTTLGPFWKYPDTMLYNHIVEPATTGGTIGNALFISAQAPYPVAHYNSFLVPATRRIVAVSGYAYTAPDQQWQENYWGAAGTAELDATVTYPENVSIIYDYYDDITRAKVAYENWAASAFPMPKIVEPRWGAWLPATGGALRGYGWDPEDTPCADWVDISDTQDKTCPDDGWDFCRPCPVSGPDVCDAACYLGDANLEWVRYDGSTPVSLGAGAEITTSGLPTGPYRIYLRAYDSLGQMGEVPVEVTVY